MERSPTCEACGAKLLWARSIHDRPVPLDAAPDPLRGNHRLEAGTAFVLVGAELEAARRAGTRLYLSHFGSCPAADTFGKRKKAGGG